MVHIYDANYQGEANSNSARQSERAGEVLEFKSHLHTLHIKMSNCQHNWDHGSKCFVKEEHAMVQKVEEKYQPVHLFYVLLIKYFLLARESTLL